MNNYDINKFEKVWGRVMHQKTEKEAETTYKRTGGNDDISVLSRFIDDEADDARYYEALSKRCTGQKTAEVFKKLSAEEREHMRKLQTAYFARVGDVKKVGNKPLYISSNLSGLQSRYSKETESVEGYRKAALNTGNVRLSELYSNLAEEEKKHLKIIENMINRVIK